MSVYGHAGVTKLNKIQFLQNQLLKVLSSKEFRYSTDKLHNEFKILKIRDLFNQEILTFMYKYSTSSHPPVFNNYYETLAALNTVKGA